MMPVTAGDHGCGLCAGSESALRALSLVDVDRSICTPYAGAHPAGVDRVAEHLRPTPRQEEGERNDVQLAFGIGASGVPGAFGPVEIA